MKQKIPVVFSANDTYFSYLYVAVYSLIKHAKSSKKYDIRILTTRMNQSNRELICSLQKDNIDITIIDLTDVVKGDDLRDYSFLSIETFYRLYIPRVLSMYEKVLYIDCDIVVCEDVSPLLEIEMNGKAIAAVSDVNCSYLVEHCKAIGVDIGKTFNAGVILINNYKFEENKIREKCLKLLLEDYERESRIYIYQDQDLLNCILDGDWVRLDDDWNFQWQYLWRLDGVSTSFVRRYKQASKSPKIIHYAGDKKPLYYPMYPMAEKFWTILKDTKIYDQTVIGAISNCICQKEKIDCFGGWQFPYGEISFGESIALYAAGEVGRAFYEQLLLSKYASVTLWVDKNYSNLNTEYNIQAPVELKEQENKYQHVIVAIDDRAIATRVIEYILDLNIPKDKIVWCNYRLS